jgi:transposase
MSMHEALFGDYPIPEDTARVAKQVFPRGNVYMQLRDHFGMLYQNHQFAHLFASEGQPALAPARLALVTVMQYMENLGDRQTAEAARDRISWKYALGLELDDPGFNYSVLSEFRSRLLTDDAEALLFDTVLSLFRDAGLLKARGKQRTDSTHVLAAIRTLHRLENIGETLRHALNSLAGVAPAWLRQQADPAWVERYAHRVEQYRLPKAEKERDELARTIAKDGYHLLTACWADDAPMAVREVPAVMILRQVWVQQFYRCDDPAAPVIRLRTSTELPASGQVISSPYDPEARYKTKRETSWLGYKVHLTETCDEDTPNLITHVVTTPATTADCDLTPAIHDGLATKGVLPSEHYLDIGYVDGDILVRSQREHQVEVVGPVIREPSWQARTVNGVTVDQFVIDWEGRQVRCPQGVVSDSWVLSEDSRGTEVVAIDFPRSACSCCARRSECTKAKSGRRRLTIRFREQHEAIQAARQRQQTPEFRRRYRCRAGVEGSFSQGNRRSGLRQARYIGLAKVGLQQLITAVALNLLRALAWLAEVPKAQTRSSAFAQLMATTG